jgi:hypothetical protein
MSYDYNEMESRKKSILAAVPRKERVKDRLLVMLVRILIYSLLSLIFIGIIYFYMMVIP